MGLPAQKQATATGNKTIYLKKGQLLFNEGDKSNAMFLLKSGVIRVFKKRGDSQVEITTIHGGQIVGELAFLDGNPRSAAAEAITGCELIEISSASFTQTFGALPDWLKLLFKTIVGRLRAASTQIKQLESVSTAMNYQARDGKGERQYVFINTTDAMKICSALLLVGARNGLDIRQGLFSRYATQVMGVPASKVTAFLDCLVQVGIIDLVEKGSEVEIKLKDIDFLEKAIAYMNEENLAEPSKRHDLSIKGFVLMSYLAKHVATSESDPKTGLKLVNVAQVRASETESLGKEAFRMDDFEELVKLGYVGQLNLRSTTEMISQINPDTFPLSFRLQRLVKTVEALNDQKSKSGK